MGNGKFWILNSWIIAALILTVFIMHLMGFLEVVKNAKVDCHLGDGIDCLETYVYTEEVIGKSKGSNEDEVVFFFTNELDIQIHNFTINLPNCMNSKRVNQIRTNETVTYNVTQCKDLIVNGFYKSDIITNYDIIQNKKSFSIISKGYISNYVYSPKMERVDKTAKRNIFDWIGKNIG